MEIPVKEIVDDELKSMGFKKNGLHWYKVHSEVVHVIELRKSRLGSYYTVNLAVWVKEFGLTEQPKSRECHLQVAIGRVPGCPDEIDAAMNEEEYWKMDAEHRRELIKLAFCNAEFEFFRELTSFDQVKQFVRTQPGMNLAVNKILAERAGIKRL